MEVRWGEARPVVRILCSVKCLTDRAIRCIGILLEFEMGRKRRPFLLPSPLLSVMLWCWHPHQVERKRWQQVVFLLRKYPLSLKQNRTETRQGQFSCSEYSYCLIYRRLLEPELTWCLGGTLSSLSKVWSMTSIEGGGVIVILLMLWCTCIKGPKILLLSCLPWVFFFADKWST